MDREPYIYLIGWSHHNRWYIGSRYAKGCTPLELWRTYFTSSEYVQHAREALGEPDTVQILRKFNDVDSVLTAEHKILRRLKAVSDSRWLNRTDNKAIHPKCASHANTAESRRNKSKARIGLRHSSDTRQKISDSLKGRQVPWLLGKERPAHSVGMLGLNNPNARQIEMDGQIFATLKEASKILGLSPYMINKQIQMETPHEF